MQIIKKDAILSETPYTEIAYPHVEHGDDPKTVTKTNIVKCPFVIDDDSEKYVVRVVEKTNYWGFHLGNPLEPPKSLTMPGNSVVFTSASYNSGSFAISTGTAAFVAIENGSNDYSLS